MVERVIAIVQARMGSKRLPEKVLADVAGHPMLWHVVNRAKRAGQVQDVIVATTTAREDDGVVFFCAQNKIACFRGSEDDVLDRYYRAAKEFKGDLIVRLTGDCPLLDPAIIDAVIRRHREKNCDYVSNILKAMGFEEELYRTVEDAVISFSPMTEQEWQ